MGSLEKCIEVKTREPEGHEETWRCYICLSSGGHVTGHISLN